MDRLLLVFMPGVPRSEQTPLTGTEIVDRLVEAGREHAVENTKLPALITDREPIRTSGKRALRRPPRRLIRSRIGKEALIGVDPRSSAALNRLFRMLLQGLCQLRSALGNPPLGNQMFNADCGEEVMKTLTESLALAYALGHLLRPVPLRGGCHRGSAFGGPCPGIVPLLNSMRDIAVVPHRILT